MARIWISIRNSMLEGERVLRSMIQPPQLAQAAVSSGSRPWRCS